MSSTHLGDLIGDRLDDHVSGVPVPPRVTSQNELDQAAADAVHPDVTNVEAVLRTVAELTGMPLVPGFAAYEQHLRADRV
jgi:hypothetical protein